MQMIRATLWPLLLLGTVLAVILIATLAPYGGNPSALFHVDQEMADYHPVPPRTIVLQMPGYDGMQYYQIARQFAVVLSPALWPELRATVPLSYAY